MNQIETFKSSKV